jgi:hypothetical protein
LAVNDAIQGRVGDGAELASGRPRLAPLRKRAEVLKGQ